MRLFSPKESAVVKAPTSGGGNPLMAVVNALFKDNINIAILVGLIMCVHFLPMCWGDRLPSLADLSVCSVHSIWAFVLIHTCKKTCSVFEKLICHFGRGMMFSD